MSFAQISCKNIILASNIAKKLAANDYSFAHLTLILLLHYFVIYAEVVGLGYSVAV